MLEGRIEIYYAKELDGTCEVRVSKEHAPRVMLSRVVESKLLLHTVLMLVAEAMKRDVD